MFFILDMELPSESPAKTTARIIERIQKYMSHLGAMPKSPELFPNIPRDIPADKSHASEARIKKAIERVFAVLESIFISEK